MKQNVWCNVFQWLSRHSSSPEVSPYEEHLQGKIGNEKVGEVATKQRMLPANSVLQGLSHEPRKVANSTEHLWEEFRMKQDEFALCFGKSGLLDRVYISVEY